MMAVTVLKPGTVAEALAIAVATTGGDTQNTLRRTTREHTYAGRAAHWL